MNWGWTGMDRALLTVPHSPYYLTGIDQRYVFILHSASESRSRIKCPTRHVSLHLDGMESQRRSLAIYIIILQDFYDFEDEELEDEWFFFCDIRNLLNSRASVLLSNLKHRDVLDQ